MELRYKVSLEEFVEGSKRWGLAAAKERRNSYFRSWRGIALLVVCFGIGELVAQWRGPVLLLVPAALAACWGMIILYRRLVCPGIFRKRYEEQKSGLDVRCAITEDGIESESIDGFRSGRLRWPAFVRQIESERTFVLYLNPLQFLILPKRAMTPEQQQELRALLAAHIPGTADVSQG